jgi:O-antigen ligase
VNASRPVTFDPRTSVPPLPWWLLLLSILSLALFVHWIAALAILLLVIIQRARPLDFLTSYLLVVAAGSFVNYGSGTLTYQMWILTAFLSFMLYCYVLSRRWDSLVIPKTPATVPLLLWFALTSINFVRGLAIGNSPRYAGLELMACLALVSALLVANRRLSERELKFAMLWMWLMSLGHFALGAYIFTIIHMRAAGVYFAPVPGVVAMMVFNYALRDPKRSGMFRWMLAMTPLLAQQFLSFTRGFWFAIIGGVAFSLVVYVGRSAGAGLRARRAMIALAMLGGCVAACIVVLGLTLGIGHVFELAGNRFASSAGTKYSWESSSNVVRLVEAFHVLDLIAEKPIVGHGLGYFFVVREPIEFSLIEQWFVHENYLLVTLKQGLIGLALWLWLLIAFVRTGLRGRSLEDINEQSWCTGAAALVVYCMVYSLVHFPLAETNTTFTFALCAGVAMRLTATDTIALRWKGRRTQPEQA